MHGFNCEKDPVHALLTAGRNPVECAPNPFEGVFSNRISK